MGIWGYRACLVGRMFLTKWGTGVFCFYWGCKISACWMDPGCDWVIYRRLGCIHGRRSPGSSPLRLTPSPWRCPEYQPPNPIFAGTALYWPVFSVATLRNLANRGIIGTFRNTPMKNIRNRPVGESRKKGIGG